jgi:hypothetical protein
LYQKKTLNNVNVKTGKNWPVKNLAGKKKKIIFKIDIFLCLIFIFFYKTLKYYY